jgi:hypothetical protein
MDEPPCGGKRTVINCDVSRGRINKEKGKKEKEKVYRDGGRRRDGGRSHSIGSVLSVAMLIACVPTFDLNFRHCQALVSTFPGLMRLYATVLKMMVCRSI